MFYPLPTDHEVADFIASRRRSAQRLNFAPGTTTLRFGALVRRFRPSHSEVRQPALPARQRHQPILR